MVERGKLIERGALTGRGALIIKGELSEGGALAERGALIDTYTSSLARRHWQDSLMVCPFCTVSPGDGTLLLAQLQGTETSHR